MLQQFAHNFIFFLIVFTLMIMATIAAVSIIIWIGTTFGAWGLAITIILLMISAGAYAQTIEDMGKDDD